MSIANWEKAHYPFKNYPKGQSNTVLFPGCAFMSQYPRTTDALVALCAEHGVAVAYDCCGMSVEGFGDAEGAARVLCGIRERLARCGCERVVCVCPNCYYYFRKKWGAAPVPEVISIYELLAEWGFEITSAAQSRFGCGMLYAACPDKQSRALEQDMRALFDIPQSIETYAKGCCGLKPEIAARGAEYVQAAGNKVLDQAGNKPLYTYCASCSGQFARLGNTHVHHVLSVALDIDEVPDVAHAFLNRAKRKFS